ncbi:endolytic peptidoglycan transglycosylase RlpA [Citrobacter sp. JGM124]|uniref:endolytic peptidoglycan transglycosylase RlpA n=1 Tax=Citrobacter sp. JGM124 TaxID=2799789 RepID=UPI001BA708D6|nr:endolytic peptidoglycan transglycosylase RlpA [Citrobacter sp. JGM124]MBS0848635.1 endolytic peptidoglycan transglycosylase RlpA [Citrobacter sp. JGM124]
MVKQWLGVCIAATLLTACSLNDNGQQPTNQVPPVAVCNSPVVEITGQEPRFEPLNPSLNQDYQRDGRQYNIVKNPANYSETGFAAIYDGPTDSNLTASGEEFDPNALTVAHPTLPVPSYARITNLANGRMLVVRVNDRGPYGTRDRVVALSRAVADRLNTSNNTRVRIDPIIVAADGSYSGPGMACTTIAKQTYALPARPDLNSGLGSASSYQAPAPQQDVMAINNASLQSEDPMGAPVKSSGFLGAPTPMPAGILEQPEAPAQPAAVDTTPPVTSTPVPQRTAPSQAHGQYVVQVGAVSDSTRAQQWLKKLSQQFATQGAVSQNGAIYRVQLGPFSQRSEAIALQQRLLSEAQQQSFITNAPAH